MQTTHHVINVRNVENVALQFMGKAALEAGMTWTMREWAARLATEARPRDYVGQLRALYMGILQRWRYVMETQEWVPGTGLAVLRHILGLKYSAPGRDPTKVRISAIRNHQKGFGDCDDVSALVAAGVIALGMKPYFRVSRGPRGAHVSVLARTPNGRLVSVDPVGHPTHKFGWANPAPSVKVFDLGGRQVKK